MLDNRGLKKKCSPVHALGAIRKTANINANNRVYIIVPIKLCDVKNISRKQISVIVFHNYA